MTIKKRVRGGALLVKLPLYRLGKDKRRGTV
jgi:hypothetical protein